MGSDEGVARAERDGEDSTPTGLDEGIARDVRNGEGAGEYIAQRTVADS